MEYGLGCKMPIDDWLLLNRSLIFEKPELRKFVAPMPPTELMQVVSGVSNEKDFVSHGCDIFQALVQASPIPISDFKTILDFGCGCGRLARMFFGHQGKVVGCDIDFRHIEWINNNLSFVKAVLSSVCTPLPFQTGQFHSIISISVFTHINEKKQNEYLEELARIVDKDGYLFLTVHGEVAMEQASTEEALFKLIDVDKSLFVQAAQCFKEGQYAFIRQDGPMTTLKNNQLVEDIETKVVKEPFEYGISFIPSSYIRDYWGHRFDIVKHIPGAIHNWQDLVVLRPKK